IRAKSESLQGLCTGNFVIIGFVTTLILCFSKKCRTNYSQSNWCQQTSSDLFSS
ncbi:hypothetical protein CPB86DRAFT_790431, partial [Serendipita vermifera]